MRRSISSFLLTPLNTAIVLFLIVIAFDSQNPVDHFSISLDKDFRVDCDTLVDKLASVTESRSAKSISRFAPHQGQMSYLDNEALAVPQVFKVISSFLESDSQRMVSSHCQAIYTDRSKAFGDNVVEMPAHCFLAQGVQEQRDKLSVGASRLIAPLKNYCVYMGQDIRQPDALFSPTKIACKKSALDTPYDLVSDSCMVYLDQPVPDSIVNRPLVWWRSSDLSFSLVDDATDLTSSSGAFPELTGSDDQQLRALLGARTEQTSCNIDSGNVEAAVELQMISHSIDFDDLGAKRVVSSGRPIYHHASQGIILTASHIPNTIDTRSGDSGGAVVITVQEEMLLIGMQVAIMLTNKPLVLQPMLGKLEQASSLQSRYYNMAINPHLNGADIQTYTDVFLAEEVDDALNQ